MSQQIIVHIHFEHVKCVHCHNGTCIFSDCQRGEMYQDGRCFKCKKGTYQSEARQTSCIPCPDGYITYYIGSFNVTDCTGKWVISDTIIR